MKKIPTLFDRGKYDRVYDSVTPGCEWVMRGEGVATRKYDGTCCLVRDGKLFKRYTVTAGRRVPFDFEPAEPASAAFGGRPGWVPVGPEDKWHREAWGGSLSDGTYELCGPKVQGNPEGFSCHLLVPHGWDRLEVPRTFDELKHYLAEQDIEGIVWHHPDGRMVKIKKRDFGMKRNG